MMMKTRIFVAKSMAKKSYKDAMDAMKTLKGKIKKPTGFKAKACLLYTSPSPRDRTRSRMPSSA